MAISNSGNTDPWFKRVASRAAALVPGSSSLFQSVPKATPSSKSDLQNPLAFVDPSRLLKGWYIWPYNPSWLVTRKGLVIYDQMKRDEQVKAALKFKKDSVLSAGWEVVSPGDQKEDWEVTRFVRDVMTFIPGGWHQVLVHIMSALDFGFSVQEKIYTPADKGEWKDKLLLTRVQSLKPHYINFSVDEFGVLQSLIQHTVNMVNVLLPPAKFIIYTHVFEFGNFYGVSDLESAYRPWWVKENASKWLAVTLERFGMAPLFAMYDPNSYSGNMVDELKKVVKGIQNATMGVIPRASKDDLEFWSQDLNQGSSGLFLTAINKFDQQIARALLVPDLIGMSSDSSGASGGGGSSGSLARSQVHIESFMHVISQIQQDISSTVINAQVIPQLCDLNFPGLQSYPTFRFMPFTEQGRFDVMKTWGELVGTQVVNKIPDDEAHIRKTLGFPENENPKVLPTPPPKGQPGETSAVKPVAEPAAPAVNAGETPLKKEQAPKVVAAEELSTEMRFFAEENDAVWVELVDGQRVAVPIAADFLDARDVHIDGPETGEGTGQAFELCKDCSGSTAPTCKKNRHCLLSSSDGKELPRQLMELQIAIDGLGSAERAVEHREAMQDRVTKLLASVESTVERNATLDLVTQRFEEATTRVADLLEAGAVANTDALERVTTQLTEAQQEDRQTLHATLTETAERLTEAQQTEQQAAAERAQQQVKQLTEAQMELREALSVMSEEVKKAARRPKSAKRDVKTGEWKFDYGHS